MPADPATVGSHGGAEGPNRQLWSLSLVRNANVAVFWSLAADGRLDLGRVVVFAQVAVGTSAIAFGGLTLGTRRRGPAHLGRAGPRSLRPLQRTALQVSRLGRSQGRATSRPSNEANLSFP